MTAASAAKVSLCVEVVPAQQSRERGQTAQWAVAAWATGGNLPDVKIQLAAAPAGAGTPRFGFGCGHDDGTSACDLGAVDASSAVRQLQAQVPVPATADTVTSVRLTATGSAAGLSADPAASAAIAVIAPPTPVGASVSLPSATLAGVSAPVSSTLSPGGNASGLFPTLAPRSPDARSRTKGAAADVADTSALPGSAATLGAQLAGLLALALAGVFAVTRISIRRPVPSTAAAADGTAPPPQAPAERGEQRAEPEDPPASTEG